MADLTKKVEIAIHGRDATGRAAASSVVNFNRVGAAARGMGLAVLGAATIAGVAMARQVKGVINLQDETAKLSRKVGVSVENISSLRLGLELSGTEMTVFQVGVRTLSKRMDDANRGMQTYIRDFDDLGISFADGEKNLRSNFEVMLDVADAFQEMEDGAKKAALAQNLFGRSGGELIPFLNQGREGIEAMQKEARDLGVTFSGQTAAAAERFNDNLLRLRNVGFSVSNQLAHQLLPSLNGAAKGMAILAGNSELAKNAGVFFNNVLGHTAISLAQVTGGLKAALVAYEAFVINMELGADVGKSVARANEAMKSSILDTEAAVLAMRLEMADARKATEELGEAQIDFSLINEPAQEGVTAWNQLKQAGSSAMSSLSAGLAGALVQGRALTGVAQAIGATMVQSMIQIGIQRIKDMALQQAQKAAGQAALVEQTGASLGAAAVQGSAWSPVAAAVSLATFGANAAPANAAIAGTFSLTKALTSFGGLLQAHDGMQSVPRSGTYIASLEAGETILPASFKGQTPGGGGPMVIEFSMDGRMFSKAIVDQFRAGRVKASVSSGGAVRIT